MTIEYDKSKLLKDKKKKGNLLKNEQNKPLLKKKKKNGNPLWKDDKLNEERTKRLLKE